MIKIVKILFYIRILCSENFSFLAVQLPFQIGSYFFSLKKSKGGERVFGGESVKDWVNKSRFLTLRGQARVTPVLLKILNQNFAIPLLAYFIYFSDFPPSPKNRKYLFLGHFWPKKSRKIDFLKDFWAGKSNFCPNCMIS